MLCPKCNKEIDDDSLYCKFCGKKTMVTKRAPQIRRINGSGSVYKISTGPRRRKPWCAVTRIGKKKIYLGTYATKTEALRALEESNDRNITELHDCTLQKMFEILVDLNKEKLTESGLTNYRSGYKYLEPYSNIKMRDIRTAHIQEAINRAANSGVGWSTWKKIQNVASLLCQLAMANDLISKNYAQLVTLPKKEEKTEKPSFTKEQLECLWKAYEAGDSTTGPILLMCYTGFRINEFLDLKKSHVDQNERIIYAPGSKTQAGKDRIIAIPAFIIPILDKMLKRPGEYLYSSPTGTRWDAKNYREREFYKTLDRYELNQDKKITPHSCRHTYAYLCAKNNINLKATMDLMGHTKYSTTAEIYAQATKKDIEFLKSEADKIQK